MRYPEFRKMNLFVGSGVIEAGCKTVIGSRLKQSGMFGPSAAPMQSSHCAVACSTENLKTTGPNVVSPEYEF
jgi:hypothetical protein